MPLAKEVIKLTYPLPVYNYKVTVDSDTLSFSEVTGLNIEYDKVVYKHGFSYAMGYNIIRAQRNEINIVLKRGIVPKRSHLYNWLNGKTKKDISIDLCDEKGNPLVRWKVSKALPLKMEGPSLNAGGNDTAIESIELIAQDLLIEYF